MSLEIELKTALFYDHASGCDWCDAEVPATMDGYGNRAQLTIQGSPTTTWLTLCADCVARLQEMATDTLAKLRHRHNIYEHPEFGACCRTCGQIVESSTTKVKG